MAIDSEKVAIVDVEDDDLFLEGPKVKKTWVQKLNHFFLIDSGLNLPTQYWTFTCILDSLLMILMIPFSPYLLGDEAPFGLCPAIRFVFCLANLHLMIEVFGQTVAFAFAAIYQWRNHFCRVIFGLLLPAFSYLVLGAHFLRFHSLIAHPPAAGSDRAHAVLVSFGLLILCYLAGLIYRGFSGLTASQKLEAGKEKVKVIDLVYKGRYGPTYPLVARKNLAASWEAKDEFELAHLLARINSREVDETSAYEQCLAIGRSFDRTGLLARLPTRFTLYAQGLRFTFLMFNIAYSFRQIALANREFNDIGAQDPTARLREKLPPTLSFLAEQTCNYMASCLVLLVLTCLDRSTGRRSFKNGWTWVNYLAMTVAFQEAAISLIRELQAPALWQFEGDEIAFRGAVWSVAFYALVALFTIKFYYSVMLMLGVAVPYVSIRRNFKPIKNILQQWRQVDPAVAGGGEAQVAIVGEWLAAEGIRSFFCDTFAPFGFHFDFGEASSGGGPHINELVKTNAGLYKKSSADPVI